MGQTTFPFLLHDSKTTTLINVVSASLREKDSWYIKSRRCDGTFSATSTESNIAAVAEYGCKNANKKKLKTQKKCRKKELQTD